MDLDFVIKAIMNSHAEYVDVALGDFRFIRGTKTFDDLMNGTGMARYRAFIAKNRKLLSLADRLTLAGGELSSIKIQTKLSSPHSIGFVILL